MNLVVIAQYRNVLQYLPIFVGVDDNNIPPSRFFERAFYHRVTALKESIELNQTTVWNYTATLCWMSGYFKQYKDILFFETNSRHTEKNKKNNKKNQKKKTPKKPNKQTKQNKQTNKQNKNKQTNKQKKTQKNPQHSSITIILELCCLQCQLMLQMLKQPEKMYIF